MAKILLVEDDHCLSETVSQWLEFEQHVVETAFTGPEAIEQLNFGTFDIVVLDWHIPDITGLEVCKQYRTKGGTTPILMLSGNDTAAERQEGLQSGANDYLRKPFHLKELSKRLAALLAKHDQAAQP
ncbi:MAG TPA: response regulator [Planktothrix sp.]|jgi:OmpR-family two-component system manganese-sensing response regulator